MITISSSISRSVASKPMSSIIFIIFDEFNELDPISTVAEFINREISALTTPAVPESAFSIVPNVQEESDSGLDVSPQTTLKLGKHWLKTQKQDVSHEQPEQLVQVIPVIASTMRTIFENFRFVPICFLTLLENSDEPIFNPCVALSGTSRRNFLSNWS
jgi:hypothetical protein